MSPIQNAINNLRQRIAARQSSGNHLTGSANLAYIGQVRDLDPAMDTQNATTYVILGDLVLMAIDAIPNIPPASSTGLSDGDDYIAQPIRPSHRTDLSLAAIKTKPTHLHSIIHPALGQHINRHPGKRYILAADAMCKLAQKHRHKKHLLICNGYEAPEHTHLDVYQFAYGQLISVTESQLHETTHSRYVADVQEKLAKLTADIPDAHILWTAPLSAIELPSFPMEIIGPDIYQHKFLEVRTDGRTQPPSPKIPAIATILVIAGCTGIGAYDLQKFTQVRTAYDQLSQSTPTTDLPIDQLRTRATWQNALDTSAPQTTLKLAETLMAAIAQHPDWQLQSLQLATRRAGEPEIASANTSPLSITLLLPDQANQTAVEQAYQAITTLSSVTGIRLTVRPQGLSTQADNQQSKIRIVADMEPQ